MRRLAVLLFLFSSTSWAESFRGFLTFENGQAILVEVPGNRKLPLQPLKQDTKETLQRLESLDFLQGQGEIRNGVLLLDSLDFVGLRRLLGLWNSDQNAILDFQGFSKVSIYRTPGSMLPVPSVSLQYSVAPSSGQNWRVFFTDENSVVLASLLIEAERATLRFFDAETGQVARTLEMTRISRP